VTYYVVFRHNPPPPGIGWDVKLLSVSQVSQSPARRRSTSTTTAGFDMCARLFCHNSRKWLNLYKFTAVIEKYVRFRSPCVYTTSLQSDDRIDGIDYVFLMHAPRNDGLHLAPIFVDDVARHGRLRQRCQVCSDWVSTISNDSNINTHTHTHTHHVNGHFHTEPLWFPASMQIFPQAITGTNAHACLLHSVKISS